MSGDRLVGAARQETLIAFRAVAESIELVGQESLKPTVHSKAGRDVVTAMDVAVEDNIRGLISSALGQTVVGEERGGETPSDGSAYWLIDPICGTRNFASGMPLYCVNLALVEDDRVSIGIVGDPSTGEIAYAERGRGAWALRGHTSRRLVTSDESRTLVIEDGKSKLGRRQHAAAFIASAIRADRWDFRSLGSTLALPYLAAGRISAYVVFWVSAVHSAPGILLTTEAGGIVSDIDGNPWTTLSDSLVASANQSLHGELLEIAHASSPNPR